MGSECGVVGFYKGLIVVLGNRPRPTNEQFICDAIALKVVHYSLLAIRVTSRAACFYISLLFSDDLPVLLAFQTIKEAVLTAGQLLTIECYKMVVAIA